MILVTIVGHYHHNDLLLYEIFFSKKNCYPIFITLRIFKLITFIIHDILFLLCKLNHLVIKMRCANNSYNNYDRGKKR